MVSYFQTKLAQALRLGLRQLEGKKERKAGGKFPQQWAKWKDTFFWSTRAICLACFSRKALGMGLVRWHALCSLKRSSATRGATTDRSESPRSESSHSWSNSCTVSCINLHQRFKYEGEGFIFWTDWNKDQLFVLRSADGKYNPNPRESWKQLGFLLAKTTPW